MGGVKTAEVTLDKFSKLGLKACELAFVHGVYIKDPQDAIRIGKKAKELDIELSIHAPYYVNLASDDSAKRAATKTRIMECCRVGELLGAKVVVFHPGYYQKDKEATYQIIKEGVLEMLKEIQQNGWNIQLAPETMGKVNVFGSIEEISRLVKDTGCSFCIDFAHILARDKAVDHKKVEKLFPQKDWHVHFSGIVYGDKGEKHHIQTEPAAWKELLQNLPKDRTIRIINESPFPVEDSVEGIKMLPTLS